MNFWGGEGDVCWELSLIFSLEKLTINEHDLYLIFNGYDIRWSTFDTNIIEVINFFGWTFDKVKYLTKFHLLRKNELDSSGCEIVINN